MSSRPALMRFIRAIVFSSRIPGRSSKRCRSPCWETVATDTIRSLFMLAPLRRGNSTVSSPYGQEGVVGRTPSCPSVHQAEGSGRRSPAPMTAAFRWVSTTSPAHGRKYFQWTIFFIRCSQCPLQRLSKVHHACIREGRWILQHAKHSSFLKFENIVARFDVISNPNMPL